MTPTWFEHAAFFAAIWSLYSSIRSFCIIWPWLKVPSSEMDLDESGIIWQSFIERRGAEISAIFACPPSYEGPLKLMRQLCFCFKSYKDFQRREKIRNRFPTARWTFLIAPFNLSIGKAAMKSSAPLELLQRVCYCHWQGRNGVSCGFSNCKLT